jgi:hypothetical protein
MAKKTKKTKGKGKKKNAKSIKLGSDGKGVYGIDRSKIILKDGQKYSNEAHRNFEFRHAAQLLDERQRILYPMLYGNMRSRIRGVAPKGGPVTYPAPPTLNPFPSSKGQLVTATVKVKGYTVKPHTRRVKIRVGQGVR